MNNKQRKMYLYPPRISASGQKVVSPPGPSPHRKGECYLKVRNQGTEYLHLTKITELIYIQYISIYIIKYEWEMALYTDYLPYLRLCVGGALRKPCSRSNGRVVGAAVIIILTDYVYYLDRMLHTKIGLLFCFEWSVGGFLRLIIAALSWIIDSIHRLNLNLTLHCMRRPQVTGYRLFIWQTLLSKATYK